ncbi:hypothetical protein TNCV_1099561 [Trichonephila clavipes]|nr:hypothetical protein TNCV_1099561 [Trichonephila clavipes]
MGAFKKVSVVSNPLGARKITPSSLDLSAKENHKPDPAHQTVPGRCLNSPKDKQGQYEIMFFPLFCRPQKMTSKAKKWRARSLPFRVSSGQKNYHLARCKPSGAYRSKASDKHPFTLQALLPPLTEGQIWQKVCSPWKDTRTRNGLRLWE